MAQSEPRAKASLITVALVWLLCALGLTVGTVTLVLMRAELFNLRDQRDKMVQDAQTMAAHDVAGVVAEVKNMALEQEASLTDAWRRQLAVGALCAFAFMVLATVIARAIRAQIKAVEQTNRNLDKVVQESQATADSLRRSEERFRTIVDTALDGVVSMDAGGLVTDWNKQAEAIFGWTKLSMIGRPLAQTIFPAHAAQLGAQGLKEAARTGRGPWLNRRIEVTAVHQDGHEFLAEIAIAPIRTADAYGFSAFARDVTKRKHEEAELQQVIQAAETASRAKSDFLAHMSHEIRTPLNGVIGMTDLLMRRQLNPEHLRYAQVIKSSANSLLALINDILDFSKIEAGKLELESIVFDLPELVQEVVEILAAKATLKKLELACSIHPKVRADLQGDPERLRQILINLISNAIKFTEKGEVVLRVLPEPATDTHEVVRFCVHDTGIGISPEQRERLFRPFSQGDASTTRTHGGTGLGLAICKQLVEMMGGEIGVESEAGRGSTFWFTAKLLKVTDGGKEAAAAAAALAGMNVLVVDDNATSREILSAQLSSWGLQPQAASDAGQALQMLTTAGQHGKPIRLALIDMLMPGVGGMELARRIKSDPRLRDTVLFLVTAMSNVFDAVQVREVGFATCLTKPVRQSRLFDSIAEAFPTVAAPGEAARQTAAPAAPAAPMMLQAPRRILLVEDNDVNQMVAEEVLRDAGYECHIVGDGEKALDAVTNDLFDLVLMDCEMPIMDGFEATRRIRQMEAQGRFPGRARLPIIAVTAKAIRGDRERCLAAGMDGYITKPIEHKALLGAISGQLSGAVALPPAVTTKREALCVPIDPETLLRRCCGKAALVEKLLEMFSRQIDGQVQEIRQGLEQHNLQALARLAHTIKGTAANLSAEPLRSAAAAMEQSCTAGDQSAAEQCLQHIEQQVRECLQYIPQVVVASKAAAAVVAQSPGSAGRPSTPAAP